MKKIAILLMIGLVVISSCKKEEKGPVLDMSLTQVSAIISPADGTQMILSEASADSVITITWSMTTYNLNNLESPTYVLEIDSAGNNFADAKELTTTKDTFYEITVKKLNDRLQGMGFPAPFESPVEFRVYSYINTYSDYSLVYSATVSATYTTYSTEVNVTPIFLVGDATAAGWTAEDAIEMTYLDGGRFGLVASLEGPDKEIKFLANQGEWAPLWGTDGTGTWESGPLVYRPDEQTTDPPAIPGPPVSDDYLIIADTSELTYTVEKSSATLFLVGDATVAGWNAGDAVPFTKDSPGHFSLTTELTGSGGMKFLEVQGAWAPQWGTDDTGTGEEGPLVYRPDEQTTDPPQIPSPSVAGTYLIEVDLVMKMYTFTKQ